jgi:uncharacterized protein YegL
VRYRILPVHLLLDATAGPGTTGTTAGVLPDVRDTWARHPALSDTLRLCVLDVAADAQVRLPLGDPLAPAPDHPSVPARPGTLGAGTLDAVRSLVETGVRALDTEGLDVQRPLVWMVVGTAPNDTWRAGLDQLCASPTRPVVVVSCHGAADPDEVGSPAVHAVFTTDAAAPPGLAVAALTELLTAVLVRTGHALGATGPVELPADDELPELVTRAARWSNSASDPSTAPGQDPR